MPLTYQLINSTSLSANALTVTFSAIPATYDDLLLKASVRSASSGTDWMDVQFNSSGGTAYSDTYLLAQGTSASSGRDSSNPKIYRINICNAGNTSNTFSSTELYIPAYTKSQNKPLSAESTEENNSTTNYSIVAVAGLWSSTSAITSITLNSDNNQNFVSGSTFWLYGIKNS